MPKSKKGDSPNKELRIVLSPEAHARIISQAKLMDQTPASFARQIIMEKKSRHLRRRTLKVCNGPS